MDLTEEIAKMNFYKTFEPYIDPSVTMEQRMKGDIRLREGRAASSKGETMTRGNILTEEEIARLAALPEKQRDYAVKIYAAREKKKSTAYILWLFFALYYFYLGHPVKNIIFWLLWSCLIGEIWWLIDLFRISDMVDETNEEILGTCIEEAKALYP